MTTEKEIFYFFDNPVYSLGIKLQVIEGTVLPEPIVPLGKRGEWDEKRVQFPTVVYDKGEQKFRMWYLGLGNSPEFKLKKGVASVFTEDDIIHSYIHAGYAESKDGLHWLKPKLGLVGYKGSKENNIISPLPPAMPGRPLVIEDPERGDIPHRFKMMVSYCGGAFLAFSQDGFNWRLYKDGAKLYRSGRERGKKAGFDYFCHETFVFLKDTFTADPEKRYRIYTQASSGGPNWIRRTGLVYSADCRNWKVFPKPVMGIPEGGTGDSGQVHGLAMLLYKGYYLAFIHFGLPHPKTGWFAPRVHLAISRDGESFRIFEDENSPLIPLGPKNSWWEGGVTSDSLIQAKGGFVCYFSGLAATACWSGVKEAERRPFLNTGLARWDLERILSAGLKPGFSEGYLILQPFSVERDFKPAVLLNAALEDKRSVAVSLLESRSRLPIPGFEFESFRFAGSTKDNWKGGWRNNGYLKKGVSVVPCLRFTGKETRVFSLTVSNLFKN